MPQHLFHFRYINFLPKQENFFKDFQKHPCVLVPRPNFLHARKKLKNDKNLIPGEGFSVLATPMTFGITLYNYITLRRFEDLKIENITIVTDKNQVSNKSNNKRTKKTG